MICCLLAYATYYAKVSRSTAWCNGTLERVHALLVSFDYVNNEQSRLLQWGIPEVLVRVTGMELRHAYGLQRLVFSTLALFVFNGFALRWLRAGTALACTALYAALIMFSAQNDLQESAPLLGLTFCLGLWAIRERKDMLFALTVLIGGLNNETVLFLPVLYFLVNADRRTLPRTALRAALLGMPGLIAVASIRYATRELPYLGGGWHLSENLRSLGAVVVFFGPFWLLAFLRFKELPRFLQRALISIPLFLIPNLMVGVITETRLLLPLTFILIPAALWTWMPEERAQQTDLPAA